MNEPTPAPPSPAPPARAGEQAGAGPSSDPRHPGHRRQGHCPLCGPATLVALPFRYRFGGGFLHGVRCAGCTTVFLDPMPSDAEIAALYDEAYFTECSDTAGAHGAKAYVELVEESGDERRRSAARFDRHLVRFLGQRGRFFEVGCGPGYLLAEMRALGWEVGGLEISAYAVREAREQRQLPVTNGPLLPGALPAARFDAVFLGDVLEHLPRPLEALAEIRRSLRPGGIVVIAVPSTLNLLSGRAGMALYRLLGRSKTVRIPPYHLFEYTPRTLRQVLERAGFRLLRLRQSAVPLRRMGLRGHPLENAGKAALQILAHATSRICNRGGDRLLAFARKDEA